MSSRLSAATWTVAVFLLLNVAQAQRDYRPAIAPKSDEGQRAITGFQLPKGMKAELFAAEPLLANPVAFCIDARGRFFVAETFRQQKGVEDNRSHMNWLHDDLALQTVEQRVEMFRKFLGKDVEGYAKEHDRIRLVVDSDGDGKADKATVYADGFNAIEDGTGAGLLARGADVYYTCIPKLWKLTDIDDDGVADERKALHHGYGVRVAFRGHDLHGLVMGPDGRVYFSIGDRGYHIELDDKRVLHRPDSGAVFRCEPDGSQLEVFAYGLRNPQELAFDDYGNLFTGDNNSDSGDKARWMYVTQDSDTGWRMHYQYLPDRGPWNREKLWHPQHQGQPAHIVPPIANLADGPSGLVHYPGVGLPDRYKGHFFLCDFRGNSVRSGIRSFAVKPKGASFELVDSHQFIWQILGTDIDFGYDGAIYISDWVTGWDGIGKGRIYRFTHNDAAAVNAENPAKLMREGFAERTPDELRRLIAHPDRRIRQEAQFALVEQLRDEELLDIARKEKSRLARIHAIWGLGQRGRAGDLNSAMMVASFFDDEDSEIRAQAARVLGECRLGDARKRVDGLLTEMLKDSESRVRYFAASSLGRTARPSNHAEITAALLNALTENADEDPVLRHAYAMALHRVAAGGELLDAKPSSPAARIGIVLALRRHGHEGLGRFLNDEDPRVVLEAARAIHDEHVEAAYPALAALADVTLVTDETSARDALLRRVLNANFRLGRRENAERVVRIAADQNLPESLRVEALDELRQWDTPPPLDRVLGSWRPLPRRRSGFVAELLRSTLGGLLSGSPKMQEAGATLAGKYGIDNVTPVLAGIARDDQQGNAARVAALAALGQLKSSELDGLLDGALRDGAASVRVEARRLKIERDPESAVAVLSEALDSGEVIERQGAIAGLAGLQQADADAVLLSEFGKMLASPEKSATIQLDLVEAAQARRTGGLKESLAEWNRRLPKDKPLAKYDITLQGGDRMRGREIFFGRTAASCRRCHKIHGSGGDVGPDLSKIAKEKDRRYLLESLVDPNAKIARGFEPLQVITDKGRVLSGTVRERTDEHLKLQLPDGSIITLTADEIDETAKGKSAMPADLVKHLSMRDIRDLVEFLAAQK